MALQEGGEGGRERRGERGRERLKVVVRVFLHGEEVGMLLKLLLLLMLLLNR